MVSMWGDDVLINLIVIIILQDICISNHCILPLKLTMYVNYISIKLKIKTSGSNGKESACNAGDLGLISGLGRSPGEEDGYPLLGRKSMTNLDSILKSRDITLPTKFHVVKALVFSSSQVWLWVLDHKEGWVPNNWCFWIVVLGKTLESPLESKEIQSILKEINPEYTLEGLMLKLKL